jgi:ribose 1,5-bisphosphokinase PhnN
MAGKLIFVSGLTGAGKTTLVRSAVSNIKNLEILQTYTTRPMRDGEENSCEYVFVDEAEYAQLKASSNNWDETTYSGYKYAADASKYIQDLANGINVIVGVAPSMDEINAMKAIYGNNTLAIWLDVDPNVAASRVSQDKVRSLRIEDDKIKNEFDIMFTPSGSLEQDANAFIGLVRNIVQDKPDTGPHTVSAT